MPVFTLATLRTKVLARLDDNSNLYTLPEIDYVINEAIRTVALMTGFYRTTAEMAGATVANRLVYTTPTEILIPTIVSFEGRQLEKLSLRKLVRLRRNWAIDNTTRCGRVDYWAPVGMRQFVITPKDAVGGRSMTMTGWGTPPKLTLITDVISLESEYVEVVTEYANHRLPLKEGGKIFADGSLALNDFYSKMKQRLRYQHLKMPRYWLIEPKPEE